MDLVGCVEKLQMVAVEPISNSFSYRVIDPDVLSKEDKSEDKLGINSLSAEHVLDEFAREIKDIREEVSEPVRNVIVNRTRRARKYAQILEGRRVIDLCSLEITKRKSLRLVEAVKAEMVKNEEVDDSGMRY
ncbi:acetylglutamate kinase [Striga asiatica]|uniref:Acetylglutamate kinase n=1 Tax=Striga asiatica TaxID=4170 RepID=A0A5A7P1L0_STRAF|nr:acetylglutamate kinase [Striga asiatica]